MGEGFRRRIWFRVRMLSWYNSQQVVSKKIILIMALKK
jgi:hypothetical protein